MWAICATNDPNALADHQRGRAASFESAYPITIGKSYAVIGMSVTENILDFLVRDDWGGPCFAPAGMFELLTAPVPDDWSFTLRSGIRATGNAAWENPIVAMWGYRELVDTETHVTDLLDREPNALRIFAARSNAAKR